MGTVEYILFLVLIVIVGITVWQTLGASISERVDEVSAIGDTPVADQPAGGSQPEGGIDAIKTPVARGGGE